jgi:polar amino acid transport system substrate-binding protein
MRRYPRVVILITTMAAVAACSSTPGTDPGSPSGSASGDPLTDKLAQVLDRGTLVGYWFPEYPPLSYEIEGAERPADTRCAANQRTGAELTGYDVETTKLVAADLGVEACFVEMGWTEVTSGNWGDRFDIAYGSGSINEDRMERLWMTQPYFAVPNSYFVAEDSPYQEPSDLDGTEIGACASCSHELYLRGELVIPGVEIVPTVEDPQVVVYNGEIPGLRDAAKGKIDAFLCGDNVGEDQIEAGVPLRKLDGVAFTYYPSGFIDKSSGLEVAAFAERVNQIVQQAQADGRMVALSDEFFGTDYASAAAEYDIDALEQTYVG